MEIYIGMFFEQIVAPPMSVVAVTIGICITFCIGVEIYRLVKGEK